MNEAHPSFREILDVTERGDTDGAVVEHIQACQRCLRTSEVAGELIATMQRAATLDPVPADVHARALRQVQDELALADAGRRVGSVLQALVDELGARARRITAALAGDSFEAALATRAGAEISAAPRMLLYETDDFEITVSLAPSETSRSLDIAGQVTPHEGELPAGGVVGIRSGGQTVTCELSSYGEFTIDSVAAGELEIELALDTAIIRLAPIPTPDVA